MTREFDARALSRSVMDAIACMAVEDMPGVADAMEPIYEAGELALYGCCCGLAEWVRQATPALATDGFYAMQVTGPSGAVIEPEDADPSVGGTVWAVRFLAAYINDRESCIALCSAAPPERLAAGIVALLGIAGAVARAKLEEADGGSP